jgi:hypothetical protein
MVTPNTAMAPTRVHHNHMEGNILPHNGARLEKNFSWYPYPFTIRIAAPSTCPCRGGRGFQGQCHHNKSNEPSQASELNDPQV